MLIRKPVSAVFEAFINPDITTQFWFTKSSGQLEAGHEITWYWEMYGVSTSVLVKAIEPDKRILIEWDGYSGRTTVEWKFIARDDTATYVTITESGWTGNGDELVTYVSESTQGFTWTLAGLKAFLEHGIKLNLVADKNPDAHQKGWQKA
ncbi:MAG TPA: SRPBCC family protein [Dongiaceae bacterium]|nr:SRPBCC family protein [Dongiaceae bacterium]